MGMNLGLNYYYSGPKDCDYFIDRMHTCGDWAGGYAPYPVEQLNAKGFPTTFVAPFVSTLIALGHANTSYTLKQSGCVVQVSGAAELSRTSDTVTFTVPEAGPRQILIMSVSGSPENIEINVIKTDQLALFTVGQLVTPELVTALTGFASLRMLDWNEINGDTTTTSTIPDVNWVNWRKVPYEAQADLCARTGAKAHVCVPIAATNAYVAAMLAIFTARGVKVKVEKSNEVWNDGFAQTGYATTQAIAKYGSGGYGGRWYVFRATQLAEQVVKPAGHEMILAWQAVQPALWSQMEAGIADGGGSNASFTELQIGPYPNGNVTADTAYGLSLQATNDITSAIASIVGVPTQAGNVYSMESYKGYVAAWKAITDSKGWKLGCYETNIHLNAVPEYGYGSDPSNQIYKMRDFFAAISDDSRMAAQIVGFYDALHSLGVAVVNVYNFCGTWTEGGTFGVWGHKQWPLIKALALSGSVPTIPNTAQQGAQTITVTPGDGQNTIDFSDNAIHQMYRGGGAGKELRHAVVPAGQSFVDTGLPNGTAYYYRATTVSALGESRFSNEAAGTPIAPVPTNALLAEDGSPLATEAGDILVAEA